MIPIFEAVKDILLQVAASSVFLFLFQWRLEQSYIVRRDDDYPDDQSILALCCALSVVLCSILSTSLFGTTYLNLAILPAFIGILYGSYLSGFGIALLFLFCNILFSQPSSFTALLLNSGVLIYPLLFGMAPSFKKGTVIEKIGMLWMALFPCMLFLAVVPILDGATLYDSHSAKALLVTTYLFFTIALGGVLVYFVETFWDKLQIKVQMEGNSRMFRVESDKLQQITNVVPLSIMSLDDKGNVAGLNELMLELIRNYDSSLMKSDLLNRPCTDFLNKLEDEEVKEQLLNSIHYKQRAFAKITCETRSYHIYTAPLIPKGSERSEGMVVVVQDITQEENMRSELNHVERLTLVGQMAAGITHEIRNPMAVVRGFLQLMREKSPDDLHSYYQIVMEELDRANSIINDFLSLAQSRTSSKEKVQLHDIIEDLSPLLWADANLRGQSVELKLSSSLPLLHLNVREIKQLILNLGRNGMEAMEAKGVLTLETHTYCDKVELIIRDTGSGMSEAQQQKLFAPFYTTKSHGTGLGLPLCLNIVERHFGKITVNSREGAGTEFTISFPCVQEESPMLAIAE